MNLSGCGNSENNILGKWNIDKIIRNNQYAKESIEVWKKQKLGIEFFKDKSFHSEIGWIDNGNWILVDGKRIKFTNAVEVFFGNIEGGNLIIERPDGIYSFNK